MPTIKDVWINAKAKVVHSLDSVALTPYSRAFLKYSIRSNIKKNIFPNEKTTKRFEKAFNARARRWMRHQHSIQVIHLFEEAIKLTERSNPELSAKLMGELAIYELKNDYPGGKQMLVKAITILKKFLPSKSEPISSSKDAGSVIV